MEKRFYRGGLYSRFRKSIVREEAVEVPDLQPEVLETEAVDAARQEYTPATLFFANPCIGLVISVEQVDES